MKAPFLFALGLVAGCLGAVESTSADDKLLDSLSTSCPVAAALKNTGKSEVSKADIAAESLKRNKSLTAAQADDSAAMFIKLADTDKNDAISKTEYLTCIKAMAKPETKQKQQKHDKQN